MKKQMKLSLFFVVIALLTGLCIQSCKKNSNETNKQINSGVNNKSLHSKIKESSTLGLSSYPIATPDEYLNATQTQQRIMDQIQIASDALALYSENPLLQDYEATIELYSNPNSSSNGMIIAPKDPGTGESDMANFSCTVCGIRSAYSCIKAIGDYMDKKGLETITLKVKRVKKGTDDCVTITANILSIDIDHRDASGDTIVVASSKSF